PEETINRIKAGIARDVCGGGVEGCADYQAPARPSRMVAGKVIPRPGIEVRSFCDLTRQLHIRTSGGRMHSTKSVSLDEAQRIIQAGIAKAKEINTPSNIAVVDAGGNLLAFSPMEEAWLGSIDISINKAFTSRAFNIATRQLASFAQPGQQFFGIHVS